MPFFKDEEKKDLTRLIVHKVIWTPEEIKFGLYDRPLDTANLDNPSLKESFALSSAHGEPIYGLKSETSVVWLTTKIYHETFKRRRKIGFGLKPEKPQKIKANPILQALKFQEALTNNKAKSKNELAKKIGLSRVRITQIMNLLKLHPKIIQKLSSLANPSILNFLTERKLRPITRIRNKNAQMVAFRKMLQRIQGNY